MRNLTRKQILYDCGLENDDLVENKNIFLNMKFKKESLTYNLYPTSIIGFGKNVLIKSDNKEILPITSSQFSHIDSMNLSINAGYKFAFSFIAIDKK
ncbi:hypothetical protein [Anaerococcus hydrogenalis]|uniref:hypothetical protein n=1 Tax=Anaerococcus hydrogenalis TaxID=33029 RepID=UPI00288993F6|nr:hypothetical protein [Anaerococcus hydrogenalis]